MLTSPATSTASIKRILPWLVAVAFFMESLDTTILNTAVPTIAAALQVGPLSMKSALTSYTLSLAVFIPVSGWMADRFGTRRVFAAAIAVFTLGSLLCGISSDVDMLVLSRILQGGGGAMMLPVGRITMVRTFAKSELIRAMSYVAIPGLVGPMLGPVVGGFIVEHFHWRMIFLINLPIGMIGLYLVLRHLPDYRTERRARLDFIGLVLFSAGVSLLSYVLEVFGEHSLSERDMLGLLAISILLLAGYGWHALNTGQPLLRLALFRVRTFRVAVGGGFLARLGITGMPFLLPLLYQVGLGYTPLQSGLLIMPQFIGAISMKFLQVRVLTRLGYRRVLLWNTTLIGVLIMLFAAIGPGTPAWQIVVQVLCFGLCASLQYTSMNTLAYADVSDNQTSNASTIASTVQQLSMSFGVAAASLVTAFFIQDHLGSGSAQIVEGLHQGFIVLGGFTILSAFAFGALRHDDGTNVSQHKVGVPTG